MFSARCWIYYSTLVGQMRVLRCAVGMVSLKGRPFEFCRLTRKDCRALLARPLTRPLLSSLEPVAFLLPEVFHPVAAALPEAFVPHVALVLLCGCCSPADLLGDGATLFRAELLIRGWVLSQIQPCDAACYGRLRIPAESDLSLGPVEQSASGLGHRAPPST